MWESNEIHLIWGIDFALPETVGYTNDHNYGPLETIRIKVNLPGRFDVRSELGLIHHSLRVAMRECEAQILRQGRELQEKYVEELKKLPLGGKL